MFYTFVRNYYGTSKSNTFNQIMENYENVRPYHGMLFYILLDASGRMQR